MSAPRQSVWDKPAEIPEDCAISASQSQSHDSLFQAHNFMEQEMGIFSGFLMNLAHSSSCNEVSVP
jgi:hypothetical protein